MYKNFTPPHSTTTRIGKKSGPECPPAFGPADFHGPVLDLTLASKPSLQYLT